MNPLGCRVGLTLKQDVKIPHPGLCQNYTSGGCQNPPFWGVKITHPGVEKPGVAGGVKITPKNPSLSMRAGGGFRGGGGGVKIPPPDFPKIPHFQGQNPTTPGRPSPRAGFCQNRP